MTSDLTCGTSARNDFVHQDIVSCSHCGFPSEQIGHTHAGQYYCSSKCYQVTCATLALLKAGGAPRLRLSTQAKAALGSSLAPVLPYGLNLDFNLMPCKSIGKTACNRQQVYGLPEKL